jgi:hypothetical protein
MIRSSSRIEGISPPRRARRATAALAALAVLALAGCETWNVTEYNVKVPRKYPIPEDATPACKDAAARARKWCRDENLATDTLWQGNCNTAQWDYSNNCR